MVHRKQVILSNNNYYKTDKLMETNFAEALAMINRGEIHDAKTIILLLHAQANRLFD